MNQEDNSKQPIVRVSAKFYDFLEAEVAAQRRPKTTILDIWLERYIYPNVVKEKQ